METKPSPIARRTRARIGPDSRPALPRHVLFRLDATRDRWVILAPERVMVPDDTAVAILQRIDGVRTLAEIAGELALTYAADAALILADCIELLQDLADKGFMTDKTERPDV